MATTAQNHTYFKGEMVNCRELIYAYLYRIFVNNVTSRMLNKVLS